jgi:hypothetical protein
LQSAGTIQRKNKGTYPDDPDDDDDDDDGLV